MKSDFMATHDSLTKTERVAFQKYINHFYADRKTALETFEHVVIHKEIDSLVTAIVDQNLDSKSDKSRDELMVSTRRNITNALSDLKKFLLEFLTVQEIQHNDYDVQFLTLAALRRRKLHELLEKKSKQLADALKKETRIDIWHKLLNLRLQHIDYFETPHDYLKNYQGEKIQALMAELDDIFLALKLKYSIETESRQQIVREDFNVLLLDNVLDLLETERAKADNTLHPLAQKLYLPLYKLVSFKSKTAYAELKTLLTTDKTITDSDKQDLIMYLFNFAAFRLRQRDKSYYKEYFDLAKRGLEKDLFIINGYFSIDTFTNIANVSCHLREYDWARQFIRTYSRRLNPEDKEIANLADARLDFEQGHFQKAIDTLTQIVNKKNIHYEVQISILLSGAYYEIKMDVSSQLNYCKTTEAYLSRNDMNPSLKKEVANYLTIMRFLIGYRPKNQMNKSEMLRMNNLLENEPVALRDYLKQKLDSLTLINHRS